ncbi:MAG TPA: hypothetical protein VGC79_23560, partial [Polyangiaceae bacterium]
MGKVARLHTELLPQEANLAGLPDEAVSQRFEELSWEDYSVFWPASWSLSAEKLMDPDYLDMGAWRKGALDPETGGVLTEEGVQGTEHSARMVEGWYFDMRGVSAGHKRRWSDAGTHVPYACPACRTSYSGRKDRRYRLSPLRNFRAGFAKTTQLLATELFDAQRVTSADGESKLVSFSDSRQDAAKAALDIERHHHQDVRRELLIDSLREIDSARAEERGPLRTEAAELRADLSGSLRDAIRKLLETRLREVDALLKDLDEPSVPIVRSLGRASVDALTVESPVPLVVQQMARLGIHPYDGTGLERPAGKAAGADKNTYFPWSALLGLALDAPMERVCWRSSRRPEEQQAFETARTHLVSKLHEAMTDVVFGKTYFAIEETGLGYVAVPLAVAAGTGEQKAKRACELSAVLRVLTDVYRYLPNPYDRSEGQGPTEWLDASQVNRRHVQAFAKAVWGEDPEAWKPELTRALEELRDAGHTHGIVRMEAVRIHLTADDARYVRCGNCRRVHLHPGLNTCTRCFVPLPWNTETLRPVSELRQRSFLARRI